jgi:hypothetical protein
MVVAWSASALERAHRSTLCMVLCSRSGSHSSSTSRVKTRPNDGYYGRPLTSPALEKRTEAMAWVPAGSCVAKWPLRSSAAAKASHRSCRAHPHTKQ